MSIKATPATVVRDYLKNAFGSRFRAYYLGDPIQIPEIALPCMIIEPVEETPQLLATGLDDVSHTLRIRILVNKKQDYQRAVNNQILWSERLQEMVSARDADTNAFLENTVLGVLRKFLTLGGRFWQSEVGVQFTQQPRPNEMVTEEAVITLRLRERIVVSGRA
jgi:hypothetical protein